VRFTFGVVIFHVILAGKLCFCENGEALSTGVVVKLVSIAGKDIFFAILWVFGLVSVGD
jgi:hypothetical protein